MKSPADRLGSTLLIALAAGLLGHTLQMSDGHYAPDSMKVLAVVLGLTVVGVALPNIAALSKLGDRPVVFVLGIGLIWSFGQLMNAAPGMYLHPMSPLMRLWFLMGLSSAAVLSGAGLAKEPVLGRARIPLLLLVHFLLGVWMIHNSPSPIIDVDTMQRDGAKALLTGINPYAMTFNNVYGNTAFWGDLLADNGKINVGFPYPPLSLLLALPGQALFGDYRFGQLAAMTGAGALMAYMRPGRIASGAAALYLFTPRTYFVLEQGWTDPFLVVLLAAVVFAAIRRPGVVPYLFGLFLAVKQYALLAVAFAWLLLPRPFKWRALGEAGVKSAVVAAVVTLPLALWNLKPFIYNLFLAQAFVPFRRDALTFLASMDTPPTGRFNLISLVPLGIALAVGALRAPRTPAGFAAAVALLNLAVFAFGAHAFCNQFYWIIGALCCAVAATELEGAPSPAAVEGDPVMDFFRRLRGRAATAPPVP